MTNLDEIRDKAQAQGVTIGLVLKERIHLLILEYLFRKGAFSNLVFQGGTALRIAYQGVRYSEDLHFVLRKKGSRFFDSLPEVLKALPSALRPFPLFGEGIELKVQKNTATFKGFTLSLLVEGLKVRDRTNIEVANIPSYESESVIIRSEDLPLSPAIRVESPLEILSDKVTAFGSREYVKGRDIWDIHFLLGPMRLSVNERVKGLVAKKRRDYGLPRASFAAKFKRNLSILEKEGAALLRTEMDRFLPLAYQDLFKDRYDEISGAVLKVLKDFSAGYDPLRKR